MSVGPLPVCPQARLDRHRATGAHGGLRPGQRKFGTY